MNLEFEQLNAFNVEKDVSLAKVILIFNHIDLIQLINERQLNFIIKAHVQAETSKAEILIDIKISEKSFVNINFVKNHKFSTIELRKSIKIRLIDHKSMLKSAENTIELIRDYVTRKIWWIERIFKLKNHTYTTW